MTSSAWVKITAGLAAIPPENFSKIGVGAAIALTLTGTILHAYLPHLRMTGEEDAKNRKLTDEQARRQIRFYGRCATFMTLIGVLVLGFVLIDLFR